MLQSASAELPVRRGVLGGGPEGVQGSAAGGLLGGGDQGVPALPAPGVHQGVKE